MADKRLKVIVNPISGSGKGKAYAPLVAESLRREGHFVDVFETRRTGDARRWASQTEGWDGLVLIGGDGTVNEVVNGLPPGSECPLALLPLGTGNVLAKELRLAPGPEAVCRLVARWNVRRFDLGVIEGGGVGDERKARRFLLMVGTGFDAEILHRHHGRRGRMSKFTYFLWGLETVYDYLAPPVRVVVDGVEVEDRAAFVLVSNVREYGGPFVFVPHAKPDDGLLDVMWFRGKFGRDVFRILWAGMWRYPLEVGDTGWIQGRRVSLDSAGRAPLQVDGDPHGFCPVQIGIVPAAISVLSPDD